MTKIYSMKFSNNFLQYYIWNASILILVNYFEELVCNSEVTESLRFKLSHTHKQAVLWVRFVYSSLKFAISYSMFSDTDPWDGIFKYELSQTKRCAEEPSMSSSVGTDP